MLMRRGALVVGLVGAVASGKSTVASLFRKSGARSVDADEIAHGVLRRPAVMRALARAFGRSVVTDGAIDRRALAERAFRSPQSARRLNRITHPHIRREILRRLRAARGIVLIDAPLLQEAGMDRDCDAVVYVDAPRRVRLRRAASRGWPAGELRRRERLQWSAARKRARADYIIDNGGPVAATERQVRSIYQELSKSLKE